MADTPTTAVYLSLEDWETILRCLRDSRHRALLIERDNQHMPEIAQVARHQAERIGATIERTDAQIDIRETT